MGYYDTPGYAYAVSVLWNYVYVADNDAGLRVVDVTNPANPFEVGFYDTPGSADGVAVAGNYAYVADYYHFEIFDCSQAVSVPNHNPLKVPVSYSLLPAYPNPFNAATRFAFQLPAAGWVDLSVYDILGQRVAVLVNGFRPAGTHQVVFYGSGLASGLYFCRLQAGEFTAAQRLILLK